MSDRRQLRYKEWSTFAVLIAVLFVGFSLLPIPQGPQSEVVRQQMYLLPIVTQPLDTPSPRQEQPSDNVHPTTPTETVLSGEEIADLLVGAFGIQENEETANAPLDFTSRSPSGLDVDEFDLGFRESVREGTRLERRQGEIANLRGNASSTRRFVPNLIQPDVSGSIEDRPRALETATTTHVIPELEVRNETRPPPVTAEEFHEAVFEDSLAAWIRANPAELDPVVLSLVGMDSEAATARATGRTGESTYELQMMLAPAHGEVRIVLIEGADLYFFVRPRVRRRASYFQKGMARHDAGRVVIAVESEDFSPEGDEAQAFYGLFLDWWRTQRK